MGRRALVIVVTVSVAAAALLAARTLAPHGAPARTPVHCQPTSSKSSSTITVTAACSATASPVPLSLAMADVVFADPAHGWAAGSRCPAASNGPCDGILETTTDGGLQWTAERDGPVAFDDLEFLDDLQGVAVLQQERCLPDDETGCPQSIAVTADGGRTWTAVYTTTSGIGGVRFATPSLGWVAVRGCPNATQQQVPRCAGKILGTTDGGRHWTEDLAVDGVMVAITSFGVQAWAAEATSAPPSAPITIWSSTAGGPWTRTSSIPVEGGLDPRTVATIVFAGSSTGWLTVLEPSTCAMHGCGVADLFGTTDGGRQWTTASLPVSIPQCGGFDPTVALTPAGRVFAADEVSLATCSPPAEILAAYDGSGWRSVHDFDLSSITSMTWLTDNDGWATTSAAIIHTHDGGRTWDQQFPPPRPTVSIAFTSPTDGWGAATVSDPNAVLHTTDGGHTWTVVADLPGIIEEVAATANDVWAGLISPPNGNSFLSESSDDGVSWATVYKLAATGSPNGPGSIANLSMFGRSGVLISATGVAGWQQPGELPPAQYHATADGGRTWQAGADVLTQSDYPPYTMIGAIGFADLSDGWRILTGFPAALDRTTDAARSWQPLGTLPDDMTSGPLALDFLNRNDGWVSAGSPALGMSLAILATRNGGRSWTRYVVPGVRATSPSTQIDFIDTQHGWLLADGLWLTTDGGLTWTAA